MYCLKNDGGSINSLDWYSRRSGIRIMLLSLQREVTVQFPGLTSCGNLPPRWKKWIYQVAGWQPDYVTSHNHPAPAQTLVHSWSPARYRRRWRARQSPCSSDRSASEPGASPPKTTGRAPASSQAHWLIPLPNENYASQLEMIVATLKIPQERRNKRTSKTDLRRRASGR